MVSAKGNAGITNDGDAHIVEHYYDAIKLRRAEGKPLADIVRSIKQALYSGEFIDTTGLAERQEVNLKNPEFQIVYHGSGAKFDAFDHSHMGEGEGVQAYGWGTYVTEVENIGKQYAITMRDKAITDKHRENAIINNLARQAIASNNGNKAEALDYLRGLLNESWSDKKRVKAQIKIIETGKFLPETKVKAKLYTVEIPEDNGSNYLQWDKEVPAEVIEEIQNKLSLPKSYFHSAYPMTGERVYGALSRLLQGDRQASEFLSRVGFAGIKYPAQYTAGGRADRASNYVIFNEADAKIVNRVEFLKTPQGVVYGWTDGKKVYLTEKGMNPETPIHEYTHLWARAMMQGNPEGWQSVKDLLRGTPVWNEVISDANYADIRENADAVASEALSRLSGRENAKRIEAEAQKMIAEANGIMEKANAVTLIERMRRALKEFWSWVGTNLFDLKSFGSIEEVTDRVLYDLIENSELRVESSEGGVVAGEPEGVDGDSAQSNDVASEETELSEEDRQAIDNMPIPMLKQQIKEVTISLVNVSQLSDAWQEENRDTIERAKLILAYAKQELARKERLKKSNKWGIKVGNTAVPFEVVRKMFEDFNSNEYIAQLFEKVAKVFETLPIKIVFSDTIGAKGTQGWFSPTTGTMKLPGHFVYGGRSSEQSKAETMLHEMIHAVTTYALYINEMPHLQTDLGFELSDDMHAAIRQLKRIYSAISADKDFKGEYGATSVHEMVAELSNVQFREKLKKKGLWETIVDAIKQLFGIEPSNALEGAEAALEYMLNNFDRSQWDKMVGMGEKRGKQMRIGVEKMVEPQPIGYGSFGAIYTQFRGKAKEAIGFLKRKQSGEAIGALSHPEIGEIDLVWGKEGTSHSDGYGLAKLVKYHPEVLDNLQEILSEMNVVKRSPNRVQLESDTHKASVRLTWDNQRKTWLLTAFEKKETPETTISSTGVDNSQLGLLDGTAPQQSSSVSTDKGSEKVGDLQGLDESNRSNRSTVESTTDSDDGLLFRDGEGVMSNADVSMANDPIAKVMGKSQRSKKQQAKFAERERKAMRSRVAELTERLHLDNVEVIENGTDLSGRKAKAKGWYDTKSGKIVISLSNHTSVADVERTLLHEAVAHHGLRGLFGKQFDTFLDNVFRNAEADIRAQIVDLAKRNGWDFRVATEEYLASLAENTNFEALENNWGWWQKIKQLFMDMLESIGWDYKGPELSDNELRYLLWRSYENMVNPGRHRSILGMAEDIAKQNELKVGNYSVDSAPTSQVAEPKLTIGGIDLGKVKATNNGRKLIATTRKGHSQVFKSVYKYATEKFGAKNVDYEKAKSGSIYMTVDLPNGHDVEIRFASHTPSGYSFGEIEIESETKGLKWSAINGKVSAEVDISFNTMTGGDLQAFLDLMNEYAENGFPQEVVEELQSYRVRPNEVSEALGISVDTLSEEGEMYGDGTTIEAVNEQFNNELEAFDEVNAEIETTRFKEDESVGEKSVKNVVVDMNTAPKSRKEAIELLATMKQPFHNADQDADIYVSNRDARHSMQYRNDAQIHVFGALPKIIESAVKIGNVDVVEDEKNTTKSVSIYYCPINVDGVQYSGRMVVKEYYNGTHVLDELHLYNILLKEATPDAQNASSQGVPVHPSSVTEYKVKELIHNSQEQDKELLGINETTLFRDGDEGILFRDGESDGTREKYNKRVRRPNKRGDVGKWSNLSFRIREAYQDSMLSLDALQKVVMEKYGLTEIPSWMNAYMQENLMSSRNKAQSDIYMRDFYNPMMEAVQALIKAKASYEEIKNYMIAKHGLERNKLMAEREAKRVADDVLPEKYQGKPLEELDLKLQNKWKEKYQEVLAETRNKDYSGLTALTGEEDVANAEAKAKLMVDAFEQKEEYAKNDKIKTLWERVNNATKATLRKTYEGGIIDADTYRQTAEMYEYYIPLRGWDTDIASDVYTYLTSSRPMLSPAMKTAHGRTSLADDPIATIGLMAESTIAQANRNAMKRAFYFFALNNPSDLVAIGKQWYIKNEVTFLPKTCPCFHFLIIDYIKITTNSHLQAKNSLLYHKVTKILTIFAVDFAIFHANITILN